MVIIDCEKMKYPNTGLFFFCDMLSKAIADKCNNPKELGFYVPQKYIGRWGKDYYYKKKIFLDKICLYNPHKLWHTTFQLAHYIPFNSKILLTVHDLNFLYEKSAQKQKKYLAKIQKLVDRADRIVTISEFTKNDLLNHVDIKGKKIDVIYNGCNIYEGPIEEPELKPSSEFIFSVATILPKKNFHVLPCLLENNDLELILAGNRSEYEKTIIEEAIKYGVEKRVHIVGPVSESIKHWYMKNCKAFVFPSIAEGFGLPVIEAMSYGKPVFLSRHTCLPEIGGNYAYYFNKDFNRSDMQIKFKQDLNNFYNGEKNPEEIKNYAKSFSWERAAEQYWEIYKEMMK